MRHPLRRLPEHRHGDHPAERMAERHEAQRRLSQHLGGQRLDAIGMGQVRDMDADLLRQGTDQPGIGPRIAEKSGQQQHGQRKSLARRKLGGRDPRTAHWR